MNTDFVENGYMVIKSVGLKKLCRETIALLESSCLKLLNKQGNLDELLQQCLSKYHIFDLQNYLFEKCFPNDLKELLLHEDLLPHIEKMLGPDIAYLSGGFLNIVSSEVEEKIVRKRPHQEMWSGAGLNELRLWTCLSDSPKGEGLEVVKGSHLYGFIPNINREPVANQPAEFNYEKVETEQGDIVLFHPLLLHRTSLNLSEKFRIAFTTGLRSVHRENQGLQKYFNWKVLRLSELSIIEKRLGNGLLSPYRVLDGEYSHRRPDDGFEDLK